MLQSPSRLLGNRHRLSLAAPLLATFVLAACSHLPEGNADGSTSNSVKAPPATESTSTTSNVVTDEQGLIVVATVDMSCVPTKEAQALGLTQTEDVQVTYRRPAQDDAGDPTMLLAFGGQSYVLREAPAASGSRYVTGDSLVPNHRGFSWHTKRNEAIIATIESGSGVNDYVDGPLLYRCLATD